MRLEVAKRDYCNAYFNYELMNPPVMANENDWTKIRKYDVRVKELSCFQNNDSIKFIDGIFVVELVKTKK